MHFSKTYAQLLLNLPPELRDNAIQYRQLKKLINQVVLELSSLGLSPDVLHKLLNDVDHNESPKLDSEGATCSEAGDGVDHHPLPRVVYEFNGDSGRIEPRLRLWITRPASTIVEVRDSSEVSKDDESLEAVQGSQDAEEEEPETSSSPSSGQSLLWALQRRSGLFVPSDTDAMHKVIPQDLTAASLFTLDNTIDGPQEVIIPLISDSAFFQLLSSALRSMSDHLTTVHTHFVGTLKVLSKEIGNTARPVSSASASHDHSVLTHLGAISSSSAVHKSDLYSWREIFQLYVEAEVFESVHEADRGERDVEESERRLKLFAERVTTRGWGDGRKLTLRRSREALETFLELNLFILNVKKFQFANSEATRKILKKHAKRTALPLPAPPSSSYSGALITQDQQPQFDPLALLLSTTTRSLPRILVQAIGTTLLPIIPHIDDYSCSICTSIAFKPIRLKCGHLFCVRCLVKMQKRGQGDCPMCRAKTVLTADRSNVDWALLNFMQDWFPLEAKAKLKQNEKEAAQEELIELGLDPDQRCILM